jgi:hypothetical protein
MNVSRPVSGFRSREKLPEIGVRDKKALWNKRIERNINSAINIIDSKTLNDIYHVSEFCGDIQRHMQATERFTQPDSTYMDEQRDIKEETRSILIDWLIKIHVT